VLERNEIKRLFEALMPEGVALEDIEAKIGDVR
jgi:hypothetical protein